MLKVMKSLLLIFTFLCFISCVPFFKLYKKDQCFEEIDKRYVDNHKSIIYRIDRSKIGFGYWVSQYDKVKKNWQKLGRKRFTYFNETDLFRYKKIVCPIAINPDGSIERTLNFDKIRKGFKKKEDTEDEGSLSIE